MAAARLLWECARCSRPSTTPRRCALGRVGGRGQREPCHENRKDRMSVINNMLLDLDKRKGRPGGEATSGDAVRSVKPAPKGGLRPKVLAGVLSFVLVGLATVWWL